MKTTVRTFASVVAAALVSFALAGAVLAADPTAAPTVGGTLDATPSENTIVVTSKGNVPATVRLTAEAVTLSDPGPFTLVPGEQRTLTYTGDDAGDVTVTFGVADVQGTESGKAVITLTLKPYTPPPPYGLIGLGLLLAAGLILVLYRSKFWRWRIITSPERSV